MTTTQDTIPAPALPEPGFTVAHQKVTLEVDFANQSIRGKTEIEIYPDSTELRTIKLNARQCKLKRLNVNGKGPPLKYTDPYESTRIFSQATVKQHHLLSQKLEPHIRPHPEEELVITLPKNIRIEEINPPSFAAQVPIPSRPVNGNANSTPDGPEQVQTTADTTFARFTPLKIYIEYVIENVRDGAHFVGCDPGSGQYPHVYTQNWMRPGSAWCLFPCVDDLQARCTWDISIKCPTTLAIALSNESNHHGNKSQAEVKITSTTQPNKEMVVLCSGDLIDDIVDKDDPKKKTVSFNCNSLLSARQIGFAIGPFEDVDLAEFRDSH